MTMTMAPENECVCGHSRDDHSGPKYRGMCLANIQSSGRQSSYCPCGRFRTHLPEAGVSERR